MKILYIVHQYWPSFRAGTENYTHSLAHSMADLGHEVYIVATEPLSANDYHIEEYKDGKVSVIKIHKNVAIITGLEDTYFDLKYEAAFKEIFEKINPEIVHVQHLLYTSIGILEFIKNKNVPIVYTIHDAWLECLRVAKLDYKNNICDRWSPKKCSACYNNSKVYVGNRKVASLARFILRLFSRNNFLLKFAESAKKTILIMRSKGIDSRTIIQKRYDALFGIIKHVDLFISPSQFSLDSYVRWGIPKDKIILSRNGMEILGHEEKAASTSKKEDQMIFASTSFIREEKGIGVLLKAFEILENEGVGKAKLLIYGRYERNSSYGNDFIKKVQEMKDVEYRGEFDNRKINEILRDVDYLILPAIWIENSPLVINEAHLNKVPCIVSNIGGAAEMVEDGINGLHFRVGDADDLAEKIRYVLSEPGIRKKFVKNIPAVKSITENAAELENIYKKIRETGISLP